MTPALEWNSKSKISIMLIVVDSLRADFGEELFKTAGMQQKGFQFFYAISPSNGTAPVHASIFTGLPPCLHKVHEKPGVSLDVASIIPHKLFSRLLHVKLRRIGYLAFLFSANPFVSPSFGYKGFNVFFDLWTPTLYKVSFLQAIEREYLWKLAERVPNKKSRIRYLISRRPKLAAKMLLEKYVTPLLGVNRQAILDRGSSKFVNSVKAIINNLSCRNKPLFIFANLMEVHEPYFPGDSFTTLQREVLIRGIELDKNLIRLWRRAYQRQVKYIGLRLGQLFDFLEEKDCLDNFAIIITSDHGQLLGEHGLLGHGVFLYDELILVPLMFRFPGEQGLNFSSTGCIISLIDLHNMVLNIALKRKTLINCRQVVFSETYSKRVKDNRHYKVTTLRKPIISAISNKYKLIYNSESESIESINASPLAESKLSAQNIDFSDLKKLLKELRRYLHTCTMPLRIKEQLRTT